MPIDVICPGGHQLRLAEKYAGKRVRCPRCNIVLEVPSIETVSEIVEDVVAVAPSRNDEDEWDDEAERKADRRRERRQRLNQVRLDVTLHLIKILSMVAMFFVLIAVGGAAASTKSERMLHIGALLGDVMRIALTVLGIVGSVLCLSVPRTSGARNMITVSLCLDLIVIAMNAIDLIVLFPAPFGLVVSIVIGFLLLGSWLTFMFFLKVLADYLRNRHLEDDTAAVIKLGAILWTVGVLSPLIVGLVVVLGCVGLLISLALSVTLLVFGIIFLIKYVKLLCHCLAGRQQLWSREE